MMDAAFVAMISILTRPVSTLSELWSISASKNHVFVKDSPSISRRQMIDRSSASTFTSSITWPRVSTVAAQLFAVWSVSVRRRKGGVASEIGRNLAGQ
jgi:hypothetical protein